MTQHFEAWSKRSLANVVYTLKYDLSLSWKDQEEPVLKFLAETMGFNQ